MLGFSTEAQAPRDPRENASVVNRRGLAVGPSEP